jgi:hypothetical protein
MVLHRASPRIRRKNYAVIGNAFTSSQQRKYNECRDDDSLQDDRDEQSAPAYFAFAPLLRWVAFDEAAFQ